MSDVNAARTIHDLPDALYAHERLAAQCPALFLDSEDVVPPYRGNDITDEDAFRVLRGRGIGIFVGRADDPEVRNRDTAAEYALASVDEVERFPTRVVR